mgnify:FL=1
MLPPDVPQYFLPLRGTQPAGASLIYQPMVLGVAQVRFVENKAAVEATNELTRLAAISSGVVPVEWEQSAAAEVQVGDLEREPAADAEFAALPGAASKGKQYDTWKSDFSGWLFRTQKLELWRSPTTNTLSRPGESERDFRVRLQQVGREQRDRLSDELRKKYAPKITALRDRVRRAEQAREKQQNESRSSQVQAVISVGASILGAFLGRKTLSATNIGRATTAIRSAGRVMKESQEVGHAEENVATLQQQLADLEAQFKSESDTLVAATDPLTEQFEVISLKPSKSNIVVKLVALAWVPAWRAADGTSVPAWL